LGIHSALRGKLISFTTKWGSKELSAFMCHEHEMNLWQIAVETVTILKRKMKTATNRQWKAHWHAGC